MLDMGFLPAIRRIVGLPKDRQTMCYSATLDANIREIVKDYVQKPVRVEIGQTSRPSDRVTLRVYTVMQDQKLAQLDRMLNEEEGSFLVFSRTKHGAERIGRKLEKLGHKIAQSWRSHAVAADFGAEEVCRKQGTRAGRDRRGRARHRRFAHCARGELRPPERLG